MSAPLDRCLLTLPLIAFCLLAATGCDSADSGDSAPNIAGSWEGVARLGGPGFSTFMELDQSDRTLSGTADLPNRQASAIEGEVDANDRFIWSVQIGCERWSGSLAIDETAEEMSGSINLDGSSCSPATSASGTLSLSR